jgi:hypothetical protein
MRCMCKPKIFHNKHIEVRGELSIFVAKSVTRYRLSHCFHNVKRAPKRSLCK